MGIYTQAAQQATNRPSFQTLMQAQDEFNARKLQREQEMAAQQQQMSLQKQQLEEAFARKKALSGVAQQIASGKMSAEDMQKALAGATGDPSGLIDYQTQLELARQKQAMELEAIKQRGAYSQSDIPAPIRTGRELTKLRESALAFEKNNDIESANAAWARYNDVAQASKIYDKGFMMGGESGSGLSPDYEQFLQRKKEAEARGSREGGGLDPTLIKKQDELIDELSISQGLVTDLNTFKNKISTGQLDLNMMANLENMARNNVAMSTEQSRNLQSFKSFLEKMRNDSLRLNNGVQTEGDAQRAFNEMLSNINDPNVVIQRLDEIGRINEKGALLKEERIKNISKQGFQEAPDLTKIKEISSSPVYSEQITKPQDSREIEESIFNAKKAIREGKSPEAVRQRLIQAGIDPAKAGL